MITVNKPTKGSIYALLVSIVCIVVDQLLKKLVVTFLKPMSIFPLWDGVFQLTYVENKGAAFGIFAGEKLILIWLTGITLCSMIVLLLMGKINHPCLLASFALIIGGGIGNLIDRVLLDYVVDYLHVTLINFAVFNFADCCIVIGSALLLYYFLFLERSPKELQEDSHA